MNNIENFEELGGTNVLDQIEHENVIAMTPEAREAWIAGKAKGLSEVWTGDEAVSYDDAKCFYEHCVTLASQ